MPKRFELDDPGDMRLRTVDGAPVGGGALVRVRELVERSRVPWDRAAAAVVTGSTVHGISTEAGDLDVTVVWTEPYQDLVTGRAGSGSLVVRTQPDGVRSGPGDVDVQVYTMRKFVSLVVGGNPSWRSLAPQ